MRVTTTGGLDHLLDDMRWRRLVGIAHAEIDDVLAGGTRLRLELTNDIEDVGRQSLDAGEMFVHLDSYASWRGGQNDAGSAEGPGAGKGYKQ
jgi:hypothetical protein